MSGETIRCADRREFDKLPQARINRADKIIVGDVVVKNRHGPVVGKA